MSSLVSIKSILNESRIDRQNAAPGRSASHNFVSAHPTYRGAYSISFHRLSALFESYSDYIYQRTVPDDSISLSESHREISPICIDIDIKKSDTTARLSDYQKRTIIYAYTQVVKRFVDLDVTRSDEILQFYLLEKEDTDNQEKTGFHGQFPFITLDQDSIKVIHLEVIKLLEENHILDNIGLPYHQIIDIIYRKAWCLYGSVSNSGKKPYLLTAIYNMHGETISLEESLRSKLPSLSFGCNMLCDMVWFDQKPLEWFLPLILSTNIAFKTAMSEKDHPFPYFRLRSQLASEIEIQRLVKERQHSERIAHLLTENQEVDLDKLLPFDFLQRLIDLLGPDSVKEYNDWFCVGSAIFTESNGSDEGLQLYKDVSSRTLRDNFDPRACEQKWSQLEFGYLDRNYLVGRAFKDSPDGAKKLFILLKPYLVNSDSSEDPEITPVSSILSKLQCISPKKAQQQVAPIKPHLVIHKAKLDPELYHEWFSLHRVVCLQSGMSTGKTTALKGVTTLRDEQVSNTYKRILHIGNRISLNRETYRNLAEDGFHLYLDIKGTLDIDRLIIQIDSLHRYAHHGGVDLLILDELETTLQHLLTFTNGEYRKRCWDILLGLISTAKKVLVCDALLTQETIEIFFSSDPKPPYIVQNTFTPCDDLLVKFLNTKLDLQEVILNRLSQGKKVVVPTNSCSFANELEELVTQRYSFVKIAKITGKVDEAERIPVTDWGQYDLVIYTSTINAGISFDEKWFDTRCCYFVNTSSPAKSCVQMLFRVRQTSENTVFICCNCQNNTKSYSVDRLEIEQMVETRHQLDEMTYRCHNSLLDDLHLQHRTLKIARDEYYYAKLYSLLETNRSRRFFMKILSLALRMHGMTILDIDPVVTELREDQKELQILSSRIKTKLNEKEVEAIVSAPLLTDEQAEAIQNQVEKKTQEKEYALEKFFLSKTFGVGNEAITSEFVTELRGKKKAYRRSSDLCELDDLKEIIRLYIREHYNRRVHLYEHVYCFRSLDTDKRQALLHTEIETEQSMRLREYIVDSVERRQQREEQRSSSFDLLEVDIDLFKCIYAIELLQACGVERFHQTDPFTPDFERVYEYLVSKQREQKALFQSTVDWHEVMKRAEERVEKKNEKIREKNEIIREENSVKKKGRKKNDLEEYTVWTEGSLRQSIVQSLKVLLNTVFGISFQLKDKHKNNITEYIISFEEFAVWNLSMTRVDNLKARHTRLLASFIKEQRK